MFYQTQSWCLVFIAAGIMLFSSVAEGNILLTNTQQAYEPGAVQFVPPHGWRLADEKSLTPNVHIMVVGAGQHEFPPSMNLGIEEYQGTLKEYLKIVKGINDAQGAQWKDLGSIMTEAGEASLSQLDTKTEWGDVRMMHVILLRQATVYILTAAALKEEFPRFYQDFFHAMRSLRVNKSVYEMVENAQKRSSLENSVADLTHAWSTRKEKSSPEASLEPTAEALFNDKDFQEKFWVPFTTLLDQQYGDMGPDWRKHMLSQTKKELFMSKE